ncbi:MAG: hypothetical protein KBC22_00830 [Candidatus Pacebacteria bacterium]|nr:hypothetical protein [Candidatus Paceibacterota bacterium]
MKKLLIMRHADHVHDRISPAGSDQIRLAACKILKIINEEKFKSVIILGDHAYTRTSDTATMLFSELKELPELSSIVEQPSCKELIKDYWVVDLPHYFRSISPEIQTLCVFVASCGDISQLLFFKGLLKNRYTGADLETILDHTRIVDFSQLWKNKPRSGYTLEDLEKFVY